MRCSGVERPHPYLALSDELMGRISSSSRLPPGNNESISRRTLEGNHMSAIHYNATLQPQSNKQYIQYLITAMLTGAEQVTVRADMVVTDRYLTNFVNKFEFAVSKLFNTAPSRERMEPMGALLEND